MNKKLRNIIIFCIITFTSGWVGVLVDSLLTEQPQGNSLGMGIWLIAPLITAIVLRAFNRDWKDTGLHPHMKGNIKWYLISIFIYPIITVITIGSAFLLGWADVSKMNISLFASLAVTSMAMNFIKNIFEEFSWRGYLTSKLLSLNISDWLLYFIVGEVWALWHAAYYMVFLPDKYFVSISRIEILLSGCFIMLIWSITFVEIYRLTKSVWPCVLMHTIEDAFPTVLVTTGGIITLTKSGELWFNPNTGVVSIAIFLGVGLILRAKRIRKDKLQVKTF